MANLNNYPFLKVHPMEIVEDPRYGRVRSVPPPPGPPAQDYRNYVTQQYETPYEQVLMLKLSLILNTF